MAHFSPFILQQRSKELKSTMASTTDLSFLLSKDYDPTDNSPSRFRQAYNDLAIHRDELREKLNGKEQRRAKFNQAKG